MNKFEVVIGTIAAIAMFIIIMFLFINMHLTYFPVPK